MGCALDGHRARPGAGRGAGGLLLAALLSAFPCSACAAASSGRAEDRGDTREPAGAAAGEPVPAVAPEDDAESAPDEGAAESERVIGELRFVRRGEDWYLVADGRRYRVLPDSLSLRFHDQATPEQRRAFLDARGFEVVRSNRLGVHDVEIGPGHHAVEWLAELTGHELVELVEVNTEGVYAEE